MRTFGAQGCITLLHSTPAQPHALLCPLCLPHMHPYLHPPGYTMQLLCWCAAVEQRLADWTMTPIWNGEGLQVLRYRKEQKYDSHVSITNV